MGNVTHPNFKRKERGGSHKESLRAVVFLVAQEDLDRLKDRARIEGRGEDEIAAEALHLYLCARVGNSSD